MADPNTVDSFLDRLDEMLLSFVEGSFGSLTGPIEALWKAMFILFIGIYGYKVIINGRFSAHDMLIHVAKILLIFTLVTSWTSFQIVVMDIVTNTPSDLAGELIKVNSSPLQEVDSANTALGLFYDKTAQISGTIREGAGWSGMIHIFSWAVFLGGLGLTGYALILISLSKVAVALLLSVAPFFILMLVFTQTKTLFEGWLRTLLNYAIIPVFVYGLLSLLLVLATKSLIVMEDNITATSEIMTFAAPFLLVCVISIGLLMQVMNIASGIAGGLSLQTMGLGKYASNRIGGGTRTAGAYGRHQSDRALDASGRAVKNKMSSGANKLKQAISKNREIKP